MFYQQELPLYLQIKNLILERVISGVYKEKIPGEHTLAMEFSVARGTIKQAIDVLVSDDVLIKHQGKGTFINKNFVTYLYRDYPAVFVSQPNPVQIQTKLRVMMDTMADNDIAEKMQLSVGVPLCRLVREHYHQGVMIGYTLTYLDGSTYSGFSSFDIDKNLYQQLRELFGCAPTRFIETFCVINAESEIANILQINVGQAIFCISRTGYDHDNKIVEHSCSYLHNCQLTLQSFANQTTDENEWWCSLISNRPK